MSIKQITKTKTTSKTKTNQAKTRSKSNLRISWFEVGPGILHFPNLLHGTAVSAPQAIPSRFLNVGRVTELVCF